MGARNGSNVVLQFRADVWDEPVPHAQAYLTYTLRSLESVLKKAPFPFEGGPVGGNDAAYWKKVTEETSLKKETATRLQYLLSGIRDHIRDLMGSISEATANEIEHGTSVDNIRNPDAFHDPRLSRRFLYERVAEIVTACKKAKPIILGSPPDVAGLNLFGHPSASYDAIKDFINGIDNSGYYLGEYARDKLFPDDLKFDAHDQVKVREIEASLDELVSKLKNDPSNALKGLQLRLAASLSAMAVYLQTDIDGYLLLPKSELRRCLLLMGDLQKKDPDANLLRRVKEVSDVFNGLAKSAEIVVKGFGLIGP
jgi:hypothetical protein